MFINLWTDDELALLYSDLTNQEIAERISRSANAVRKKRYLVTGHYVEKDKQLTIAPVRTAPLMSDAHKEARIIGLCERLKVKLYG